RPLELPDHGAEFELQELKDRTRRIALGTGRGLARCRYRGSRNLRRAPRIPGRHGRFHRTLSKQAKRHGVLLVIEIRAASSHPCMKSWLTRPDRRPNLWLKRQKAAGIFDFARFAAYNAALSTPSLPTNLETQQWPAIPNS